MGSVQVEFKNPATSTLLDLVKARRTHYALKAESPISDAAIEKIVQDAVLHVPSSFNTQTSRVVLLLKEEHQKVWDIAISIMEGLVAAGTVPKEMFENHTKPKLEAFRGAYGTVSFAVRFPLRMFILTDLGSLLRRLRVSGSYQGEVRHLRRQVRSFCARVQRHVSVPWYVSSAAFE
jgi:hypothetical protein